MNPEDITLAEIRQATIDLESTLTRAVKDYEVKTGQLVVDILNDVARQLTTGKAQTIEVRVRTELNR